MRWFKIFAQRRKEMGDLLPAVCLQKVFFWGRPVGGGSSKYVAGPLCPKSSSISHRRLQPLEAGCNTTVILGKFWCHYCRGEFFVFKSLVVTCSVRSQVHSLKKFSQLRSHPQDRETPRADTAPLRTGPPKSKSLVSHPCGVLFFVSGQSLGAKRTHCYC